jgi:hypothetical protein
MDADTGRRGRPTRRRATAYQPRDAASMRHLRIVSFLITAVGIIAVVVASILDAGAMWILAGLLLAWAGIVKIVVVHLWERVAGLGGPAPAAGDDD